MLRRSAIKFNLSLRANNNKINFSSLRTATLDELLRHPILDRESADPDTLQDLDAFPVPILPGQVTESLRREFGYPMLSRTEWEQSPDSLEAVRGDWWRAARLIHETLAIWRNRPGNPVEPSYSNAANCQRPSRGIEDPQAYSDAALAWIQSECTKMYAELQGGCTNRYESPENLLPTDLELTQEQVQMVQPALVAVSKAKELHPAVKKEIVGHICSVIVASMKQKN